MKICFLLLLFFSLNISSQVIYFNNYLADDLSINSADSILSFEKDQNSLHIKFLNFSDSLINFLNQKSFFLFHRVEKSEGVGVLIRADKLFEFSFPIYSFLTSSLTVDCSKKDKFGMHTKITYNVINLCKNKFIKDFIDSTQVYPYLGKLENFYNEFYYSVIPNLSLYLKAFEYIRFEAGYFTLFIGNGYRTLFLNDLTLPYYYFRSLVELPKVKYLFQYSILREGQWKSFNNSFENKCMTFHFFEMNLTKNLTLNGIEMVIWQAKDSFENRFFEINYAIPLLFLRPVEWALGSPDNVIMGLGLSYKFWNYLLYCQVILDDINFEIFKQKKDWWGNKFGCQLGIKSYKLFNIHNLFYLFELNIVRPFTYSYATYLKNYGNYHLPLAHPLGANFVEFVSILQYKLKKFVLSIKSFYQLQGLSENFNVGNNIYVSYNYNRNDYGNYLLNGKLFKNYNFYFNLSYLLRKNFCLYLEIGQSFHLKNNYMLIGISNNLNRKFLLNNL